MTSRNHHQPPRRLAALLAGATAACLGGFGLAPAAVAAPAPGVPGPLTAYVNPFVGSLNAGNTYPGASMPFGAVQF
ncbi:MAG: hypothetical protein LBT54_05755, partial [Bifidobacteriaceae bacterium]|nr:hypothetical protein [Bifidobacteriaceae bacterium]